MINNLDDDLEQMQRIVDFYHQQNINQLWKNVALMALDFE